MDIDSRKDQDDQQEQPQEPIDSRESESPTEKQGSSRDELFAEIRQSLREEDSQGRKPGFAQRLKAWGSKVFKRKPKPVNIEAMQDSDRLSTPTVIEESVLGVESTQTNAPESEPFTDTVPSY